MCVHACMTPWTLRVNTPGAAGVLTRNVVLHLFSVGFPHVSVGGIVGNHWRLSSARSLFQRAIEPCVSRACDFQRYQVSLATHSPNGKTDSMPGCMFQQPMRLSSTSHLSDGWQESVFPAAQTVGEVVEDAPEHLNQNDKKYTISMKKQFAKPHLSTIVLNKMFLNWLPATTVSLSATQIVADEFPSPVWAKPRLFQYNVEIHCFNTMLKSIVSIQCWNPSGPELSAMPVPAFRCHADRRFGHGKNYIDLIFTLLKNKYLISEKNFQRTLEYWSDLHWTIFIDHW